MIIVRVTLYLANGWPIKELARMEIVNCDGLTTPRRNYVARTLCGRDTDTLNRHTTHRETHLENWPAEAVHIWNLVAACLERLGYTFRANSGKSP